MAKAVSKLEGDSSAGACEKASINVVCAWLGNSPCVADEHYLQVTEADFEGARKPCEKATQSAAATGGTEWTAKETDPQNPLEREKPLEMEAYQMGGTRLELVTSTV